MIIVAITIQLLPFVPFTPTNTNAVVWKVTPLFATWISSPTNFLFTNQLITPSSTILELGAGVSGIVALCLGSRVASYTATDQDYVLKLLRQNIAENLGTVIPVKKNSGRGSKKHQGHSKSGGGGGGGGGGIDRITTLELDWETDATFHLNPVDMIVACDCVYNEALVEPLNATCAALCRLKEGSGSPTLCLIAQQLRSPEVFETWLKSFHRSFHVWQVPDSMLGEGLKEGSGFVVHVGIVR
jgi:hypothetical protein